MGCSVQLEPIKVEQEKKGQEEVAGCCKICYEANDDSPLLHGVCDCKGSLDGVHGRYLYSEITEQSSVFKESHFKYAT